MSSHRQLFFEHLAQTSDFPMALEIVSASGNYLHDKNGKKYLDLISGISVSSLGHNNPEIKKAIQQQLDKHLHLMVYGEFIQSVQVNFATALAKENAGKIDSFFFVNSGSEAIEGAMKLAKRFTGRAEIISFNKSYHGATQGAISLGGNEDFRKAFYPLLPGMKRFDYGSLQAVEAITKQTACVIVEPIQAEAGIVSPPEKWISALRKKCTETGALLIFDEVQTCFARTGKFFAWQSLEIEPDVLVLGKALGGGMPLGAFAAPVEIMKCLRNNPVLGHITTFGGHPLSCAAGLKTLEIIRDEQLGKQVTEKEKLFLSRLTHKNIREVRSKGLLMAVQLESFEKAQKTIEGCIQRGLITDWFLYNDSALRIAPPLTITNEEIEFACSAILESL